MFPDEKTIEVVQRVLISTLTRAGYEVEMEDYEILETNGNKYIQYMIKFIENFPTTDNYATSLLRDAVGALRMNLVPFRLVDVYLMLEETDDENEWAYFEARIYFK